MHDGRLLHLGGVGMKPLAGVGRSKNLFASENHPATFRAGAAHWRAKLSSADVVRIRELHSSGLSQTHISAIFNVHSATISRIVRREWRKEVA